MAKPPPSWILSRTDHGKTLQDVLRDRLQLSGRRAKALLDQRTVFLNGQRIWMARHTVRAGDRLEVHGIAEATAAPAEKRPPIPILHRDQWLLAANKPAGCVSDLDKDSLEAQLQTQCKAPALRALHRLDRDTSGALLFTLDAKEREPYLECFREKQLSKRYLTIVRGTPSSSRFTVRTRLDGKEAETCVTRLQQQGNYALLSCEIPTGRTHQIRRHLLEHHLVIVGEKQYGQREGAPAIERSVTRQMLHAHRITFTCPHTRAPLNILAPPPEDFLATLRHFGLRPPKY